MRKFPSIEQYRNAIRNVIHRSSYTGRDAEGNPTFDASRPKPVVAYRGTVKLHGTNAGIVYNVIEDTFQYQSRERVLELTSDNAGFCLAMMGREAVLLRLVKDVLVSKAPGAVEYAIYGEWCGQGIQRGVAISELPKMFVVFGVKAYYDALESDHDAPDADETGVWVDLTHIREFRSPDDRIFNIIDFPTYELEIDFSRPELAQQKMVEITESVEQECPVGKFFGVSGVGEGVVWMPADARYNRSANWFKVKGEKHSATKVKTLAAVDVEAAKSLYEFVEATVTDARLEQGLHVLQTELQKPFEMTSMGDFIRWVFNDVVKEERDTIVVSAIDPKKIGGLVANKARPWFIQKFNEKS